MSEALCRRRFVGGALLEALREHFIPFKQRLEIQCLQLLTGHASVQRCVASDADKAAPQPVNARSKVWGNTILFLNRDTPEAIAQRFPFRSAHLETMLETMIKLRSRARNSTQAQPYGHNWTRTSDPHDVNVVL